MKPDAADNGPPPPRDRHRAGDVLFPREEEEGEGARLKRTNSRD